MTTYLCPKAMFLAVAEHAAALDIEIVSAVLDGATYTLTTAQPFPADQLEHLALTEV